MMVSFLPFGPAHQKGRGRKVATCVEDSKPHQGLVGRSEIQMRRLTPAGVNAQGSVASLINGSLRICRYSERNSSNTGM